MDTGIALTVMSVSGIVIAAILKFAPERKNGYLPRSEFEMFCHNMEKTLTRMEGGNTEIFNRLRSIEAILARVARSEN